MLKLASVPLWRQILRSNFTQIKDLLSFLELEPDPAKVQLSNSRFVLNLPLRLAQKIKKKTWDDPILKQFLPSAQEQAEAQGFCSDPIGDLASQKSPKLLHKYEGRALLVTTSACAMHCRYCFRQNFPYDTIKKPFKEELDILRNDPSIKEVILSGGDPLSLSDHTLEDLLSNLYAIPHIKLIRFHSRYPIGIPERIDDSFLKLLSQSPVQIWFVVHVNHPSELDEDVVKALASIRKQGAVVLNQSVLLKGVNDHLDTLKALSEKLVESGIMPYYLHQLDRVSGASSFEVEESHGKYLIQELTKQLPGYAVPKYVREIAGEPNKTQLHFIDDL